MSRRPGSRGFYAALTGLGMTIFSWYSPWAWPAYPALAVIDLSIGQEYYAEAGYAARAFILTLLIVWNTAVWSVVSSALFRLASRVGRRAKDANVDIGR